MLMKLRSMFPKWRTILLPQQHAQWVRAHQQYSEGQNFVASWQTESWAVESLEWERDAHCVHRIFSMPLNLFITFPRGRSSSLKRTWATLAMPLIAERTSSAHRNAVFHLELHRSILIEGCNWVDGERGNCSTSIFTVNGAKMRNIFWLKGEAEAKSLHPLKCERVW